MGEQYENESSRGWMGDIDWIYMAQDRDGWWAVGNALMNLGVL
jgi:hypothetical protein